MGQNGKAKCFKHHTVVIESKQYPSSPATFVANKNPRSLRPKGTTTRRKCLKDCSNTLRRRFNCFSSANRGVSTYLQQSLPPHSIVKQLLEFEWMFDHDMPRNITAWRILTSGDSNIASTSSSEPSWDQPPSIYPNGLIRKYTGHLHYVWGADGCLQIPVSWNMFQNVNWELDGSFHWGATDSSGEGSFLSSVHSGSNSSRASSDNQSGEESSPIAVHSDPSPPQLSSESSDPDIAPSESKTPGHIVFRGEHVSHSRTREQLNLLATMVPHRFDWRPQTEERSLARDRLRHAGYVDLNQGAVNHDIWPQNSFSSLLSHWTVTRSCDAVSTVSEVPLPQMLGRILASTIETEIFPAYFEQATRWPSSLVKTGISPTVDYTCRATPQSIGWRDDTCPLLFAAQFNPSNSFSSNENDLATWKLAETFRPMMAIFVLFYLDTRTSPCDPLPFWMVLFGIVYTESGVVIRGHAPCFQPNTSCPQDIYEELGWRATSWNVYWSDCDALLCSPDQRGPLLFTLNRIQGHCKLVFERLKAWEGYSRACQLLNI